MKKQISDKQAAIILKKIRSIVGNDVIVSFRAVHGGFKLHSITSDDEAELSDDFGDLRSFERKDKTKPHYFG